MCAQKKYTHESMISSLFIFPFLRILKSADKLKISLAHQNDIFSFVNVCPHTSHYLRPIAPVYSTIEFLVRFYTENVYKNV